MRSEQAVATIGEIGWGADCQVRELDGGERVARGTRVDEGACSGASIFCDDCPLGSGTNAIRARWFGCAVNTVQCQSMRNAAVWTAVGAVRAKGRMGRGCREILESE